MNAAAGPSEARNPKTDMTHAEMKEFIRNHFEEFVNRKNLRIGEVNFAAGFVDHEADVPPGLPPGPAGAIQYVGASLKRVPDLRVSIEELVAEDDKVVVRNRWTGTDAASKQRLEFSGIVIWRIANRQIVERWAYLESPHPARLGSGA
jgi:predicted SnoaL-like aldol condensation-catalyzing enzyme